MNYHQAVDFLLSLNNLPRRDYMRDHRTASIYIERLQKLLELLGNPERKIRHYIHITGTSGKGSVAIMLASILRAAGRRVGLLTSPHPSVLTERWEVNGRPMPHADFVKLTKRLKIALDEYLRISPYDVPSFFEIITAIGLCYFADKRVHWAVIEVGVGGRHDSTNVIPHKDLAIITSIGLDHKELIGPTKSDIAREKAGIITSPCRVLTAETNARLLRIIQIEARKHRAVVTTVTMPTLEKIKLDNLSFIYKGARYVLPTFGSHQIQNAALAIEGALYLAIPRHSIYNGLRTARLPIRLEIIARKPLIILDGAHNEEKMATTVTALQWLRQQKITRALHLVVGFSADKDVKTMLRHIAALKPVTVACTRQTANPQRKAADPRALAALLKKLSPKTRVDVFLEPVDALQWCLTRAQLRDGIAVTGSIFLSGDLRARMRKKTWRH